MNKKFVELFFLKEVTYFIYDCFNSVHMMVICMHAKSLQSCPNSVQLYG